MAVALQVWKCDLYQVRLDYGKGRKLVLRLIRYQSDIKLSAVCKLPVMFM